MIDDKARGKGIAPEIGNILGRAPDPSRIPDTLTYFYIKRIKGWMACPACGEMLLFAEEKASWDCENCAFSLPEEEFLDDYVFWFCDGCGDFLNAQNGFDRNLDTWTCTTCRQENDITRKNLRGICRECGELLDNPNASLCSECEMARLETAAQVTTAATDRIEGASHTLSEDRACRDGESKIGAGLETALPRAAGRRPSGDASQTMGMI